MISFNSVAILLGLLLFVAFTQHGQSKVIRFNHHWDPEGKIRNPEPEHQINHALDQLDNIGIQDKIGLLDKVGLQRSEYVQTFNQDRNDGSKDDDPLAWINEENKSLDKQPPPGNPRAQVDLELHYAHVDGEDGEDKSLDDEERLPGHPRANVDPERHKTIVESGSYVASSASASESGSNYGSSHFNAQVDTENDDTEVTSGSKHENPGPGSGSDVMSHAPGQLIQEMYDTNVEPRPGTGSVATSSASGSAPGSGYGSPRTDPDPSQCTREMFQGDENAFWACLVQHVIQVNWFPSPVAGLYLRSYLDWNGFDGFWQNGSILESLANFLHYTASQRYSEVFMMAGRSMEELLHAYYPQPSFDDEGWFAVSYARVYEVTGNSTYLNTSRYMYDFLWQTGWDSSMSCSGGMWFGGGHGKKITITNAQMLLLGAKLYRLTQNETYLHQSMLSLNYMLERVVDPKTFILADSISPYDPDCTALPKFNITYNAGMFIGGLVELYKATGNGSHLELAHNVALATINNSSNKDGVLLEYCDWDAQCDHDDDAKLFKGIFVRNLRYLMDVSNTTKRESYQKWLQVNINSAISKAICEEKGNDRNLNHEERWNTGNIVKTRKPKTKDTTTPGCLVLYPDGNSSNPTLGPLFTTSWAGPYLVSSVISQTAALDLFVAAIDPDTECEKGNIACDYNPHIPDIKPLTCADNPCQKGHTCCTWDEIYATCCMPYETCYDGGCY